MVHKVVDKVFFGSVLQIMMVSLYDLYNRCMLMVIGIGIMVHRSGQILSMTV